MPLRSNHPRPDAIDMLQKGHHRVQKLLRGTAAAGADPRTRLRLRSLRRACSELRVLAALEAEILYPAVRSALELKFADEGTLDLCCITSLLDEIETTTEKSRVVELSALLAACVAEHVQVTRAQVFPRMRRSQLDLDCITADMRDRRRRLVSSMRRPAAGLQNIYTHPAWVRAPSSQIGA